MIDYIKNGRPLYHETDHVFLKHMPPFDPIGNENHMQQQLVKYMRKRVLISVQENIPDFIL